MRTIPSTRSSPARSIAAVGNADTTLTFHSKATTSLSSKAIKNFGPVTMQWLLSLLNACARTHRLPRLWRRARVVALLKPRKDPSSSKSYRPISHFVSPLQTVRAPDTEPPVSHYRTCPYTRAGWLSPRQILHCPGVAPLPAHRIWL